jgi:hypothetical protein
MTRHGRHFRKRQGRQQGSGGSQDGIIRVDGKAIDTQSMSARGIGQRKHVCDPLVTWFSGHAAQQSLSLWRMKEEDRAVVVLRRRGG